MAKKKKKLKLKKTVRRTIASLLMITAIIVAAVPAPQVQAEVGTVTYDYRNVNAGSQYKDIVLMFGVDDDNNTAYLRGYNNWADDNSSFSNKSEITDISIPSQIEIDKDNNGNFKTYTVVGIDSCDGGSTLNTVKIEGNTITSIGNNAFKDCTGLKSINFPSSLTSIGENAFSGCINLTGDITLSSQITSLGSACFKDTAITGLTYASPVKIIPSYAFYNTNITSLNFQTSEVTHIEDYAFGDCTSLTDVSIPEGVTNIGQYSFYGCEGLKSVSFPNSLSSVGEYAFAECKGLQDVYGLENTNLQSISKGLFCDDSSLKTALLPSSCGSIGDEAFYRCSNIRTVVIPYSIKSIPENCFSYATGLTYFLVGNNDGSQDITSSPDTAEYEYAYNQITSDGKDISIPDSAITAGSNLNVYGFGTFNNEPSSIYGFCEKNTIVKFHDLGDGGGSTYADGIKVDTQTGYVTYVDPTKNTGDRLEIPPTIGGIEVKGIKSSNAFPIVNNEAPHYTTIVLPDTCTYIGAGAFSNCSELENLIAKAKTVDVDESIYLFHSDLPDLKITGGITSENDLFNYIMKEPMPLNTSIDGSRSKYLPFYNVDYADLGYSLAVKNIDGYVTLTDYDPTYKDKLTIPSGIQRISLPANVLSNNPYLQELIIEEGLLELDDYQFLGDENLTSVSLPSSLTKFGDSDGKPPFTGCTALGKITFADGSAYSCDDYGVIMGPDSGGSGKKIYEALEGNSAIGNYNVDSGVTSIDPYAFYNNAYLSGINTANAESLTSIPEGCFSNCSALKSIVLGASVGAVNEYAFANGSQAKTDVYAANPKIKYNNLPFAGNKKDIIQYYFHGTPEDDSNNSYVLANQSDLDGLIWGGSSDPQDIDSFDDTYSIKVGPYYEYVGSEYTVTLKPRSDSATDLKQGEFALVDNNGVLVPSSKYIEKENGWTVTINASSARTGYVEFKVYGDGVNYASDSFVTGKYPIKDNSGGGGGGGDTPTVSGNLFYVEDLNPDIFEYSASAIEPDLTVRLVKNPLTILTENKDYYVKYENNYYPGVDTAKATVQGINSYNGANPQEVTYSIKKNIAECPMEVENGAYTGQLVQPAVHVFDYETDAELVAGTDYVVTRYENNVKKGKNSAKAYVEGIGKYFGDNSGKFSILKTTSSTSKSTSSTSKSSSSTTSSSSSASSSSNSSSSSTNSGTTSGNTPGNQSPGTSGRAVPVDTGDSGIGDASGTIEGTTDNYVIKITKTDEADAEFNRALSEKYGDLSSYRQFAMDISLYDSTGEHKIEDPQGIAVTLTVPIPEELALYGGNNKVAAVDHSGSLENLSTRYSMIDGAPCATFTATHFSPYGFYVDTNNLTAGDLDNTPKTGDPISPKWVIAIGLAALSIFLFLKKDPVPHAAKA